MFKSQNRLPRGVGFYNSSFFPTSLFVLKVKENGLIVNRFGIIVSKKIDKRAVARNRIKRVFRQTLVNLNKEMEFGYDMLFIVKPGIINRNSDEIAIIVKQVLEKAKYIK